MEHKLIQGGEQYLPFARSRIKALRATGLRYASQQFEIDGVSIKVRIAGDQEFISASGGSINVLSGVTKDAEVVDIPAVPPATEPTKTLRSFKPTADAWKHNASSITPKPERAFRDEDRFGFDTTQYGGSSAVNASMFSGLMAKAVQLILGIGKTSATPDGVNVPYNYAWNCTHIVSTAADGKLWLVEISAANGVIAMPFGVKPGGAANSSRKIISESFKLFKGVPTGATFPSTPAKIAAAIVEGSVIRLATVSDLLPFHSKNPWALWMGWSVNDTGSEAHNTCYDGNEGSSGVPGTSTSHHYKLAIAIGATVKEREPNQPMAVGTATLTLVENGPIWKFIPLDEEDKKATPTPYGFANPLTGQCGATPGNLTSPGAWQDLDGGAIPPFRTPIFVCHIGGVLDVVYLRYSLLESTGVTGADDRVGVDTGGELSIDSSTFPYTIRTVTSTFAANILVSQHQMYYAGWVSGLTTSVIFPGADRDAYLHFKAGSSTWNGGATINFTPPTVSAVHRNGHVFTQGVPGWEARLVLASDSYASAWPTTVTAWNNPGDQFGRGLMISSVFGATGADTHSTYQRSAANPVWVTEGPVPPRLVLNGTEFTGETSPSDHIYNFLGYV